MRFTSVSEDIRDLVDTFHCRARRKELTLDKCLNDYLEANAFDRKRSACYRCPQGRRNREAYAGVQEAED
ncbi:hypothetical protein KBD49_09605 [Myxococcota bacterium]|nr:hypothetical protein [Myxococcota bacterium]